MTVQDLEASIGADVDGIAVTKAQSAEHLKRIDELHLRARGEARAARGPHAASSP